MSFKHSLIFRIFQLNLIDKVLKFKIISAGKSLFVIVFGFLFTINSLAQGPDSASFSIFLIGDAGESDEAGDALLDLQARLKENSNGAVIFLGDNCYKKTMYGLIPLEIKGYDGSKLTKAKMMSQLNILRDYKGYAYMIPGNHDWWNVVNVKKGKKNLLKEQKFVEDTLRTFTSLQNYNTGTFLPSEGSAGPVFREVDENRIRLIFIDSYRLLLEESEDDPDTIFLSKFYHDLDDQLSEASLKKKKVVVVAHHPIYSIGKHSQPMMRVEKLGKRFGTSNSNYPPYRKMNEKINALLKKYPQQELYYASGHEHSLEYFRRDGIHYIVSGSGSKEDEVDFTSHQTEDECVQWNEAGFFEIVLKGSAGKVLMYHRADEKTSLKVVFP